MATSGQVEAVERLVHESVARVDAIAPESLRLLLPALRQARDELQRDLQRWLEKAPNGSERFTAYQRTQALRALEASLERIEELQPAMSKALRVGRTETGGIAVANLSNEVTRLSSIFGGGALVLPQIDTAAIIAKGDKLLWRRHENSSKRYAGSLGDDIKHRLAVSLAKGDTFEQAVQRLRGSSAFRQMVSVADPSNAAHAISDTAFTRWRHWADRLVRTENMHAYNVQHDLSIDHVNANRSEEDEEYLRRWDATADKVTCPLCRELDRTLATIKGDFKGGIHSPPRHPYCRCVVLAWLARWGHFKGETPSKGDDGKDIAPTPEKPKPEPKREPAPTSLDASLTGDFPRSRELIQERAAALGMAPKTGTLENGAVRVKDLPTGIGGYRHWDGSIEMSREVAAEAKRFADAYKSDPEGVRRKFAAYRQEIAELRAGERTALSKEATEGGRLLGPARAYHVQYHETAHGYGPTAPAAYTGTGAKIEEVSTEMASRRMFREQYGIDLNPHSHNSKVHVSGPYEKEIQEYINRARVLLGPDTTYERGREVLERASIGFKKLPENGKLDLSAEFDKAIKRAGAEEAKERERLRSAEEQSARRKGVARKEPQADTAGAAGARAATGQPGRGAGDSKRKVDTSLPQDGKPGKVEPVTTKPKKELPIKVEQASAGHWFAEQGKNYGVGKTEAEARENLTKQIAEKAAEAKASKERKEREATEKAERAAAREKKKADKAAGIKPTKPVFDPTSRELPPGARLATLRRSGLIERVEGKWMLNDRGVRFFLDKQAKDAAVIDCTCQICAGTWALHNGRVSLHGYNRPGYGFIQGSCRGSQRKPWEVSSDAVAGYITELRGMLSRERTILASIPTRDLFGVEEPVMHDPHGYGPTQKKDAKGRRMFQIVHVKADDPRFAKARTSFEADTVQRIEMIEKEITRMESRLASWSPDAAWIKAHGSAVK